MNRLFGTIACVLALASSGARAVSLSGPVDNDMLVKAVEAREPVEIASPGGNLIVSMTIAQIFRQRGIAVRVTGQCASGCAMIAIGSRNCTVARSGHLILHAPGFVAGGNVTDFARNLEKVRADWKDWMQKAGVPSDLIEATLQAYRQQYELSPYAMKRVGCQVE